MLRFSDVAQQKV